MPGECILSPSKQRSRTVGIPVLTQPLDVKEISPQAHTRANLVKSSRAPLVKPLAPRELLQEMRFIRETYRRTHDPHVLIIGVFVPENDKWRCPKCIGPGKLQKLIDIYLAEHPLGE